MKFYISARYGRRLEAEALGLLLTEMGHEITSRWVWREQPQEYETATPEEIAEYAEEDVEDVLEAEALVALSEPSDSAWGRGSRHVEFGIALALAKMLFVIGPYENVFHYMADVTVADNVQDFILYIQEEPDGSSDSAHSK